MKRTASKRILVFLAIATVALAGVTATLAAPATSQVFTGQYDWTDGGRDGLSAGFTPDGVGRWKVEFRFEFDGESNTWSGSAEGKLEDGSEITGTATWRGRQWIWNATLVDGVLRGTHMEVRSRGKTRRTGTFELRRKA